MTVVCSEPTFLTDQTTAEECLELCLPGGSLPRVGDGGRRQLHRIADNRRQCTKHLKHCRIVWPEDAYRNNPTLDVILPSPPMPLEDACSKDMLMTQGGRAKCEQMCSAGHCCFEGLGAEGDSCFADNPNRCLQYSPCRANVVVPDPPPSLQASCQLEWVGAASNEPECTEARQLAACCWENGYGRLGREGEGLFWDQNLDTCRRYEDHCHPDLDRLRYGMKGAEHTAMALSDACSVHSLRTRAGAASCHAICKPAWCCTARGTMSCLKDSPTSCGVYSPICWTLLASNLLYEEEYQEFRGTGNSVGLVCSLKSVMTPAGLEDCRELCSSAKCCFDGNDGRGCGDEGSNFWRG